MYGHELPRSSARPAGEVARRGAETGNPRSYLFGILYYLARGWLCPVAPPPNRPVGTAGAPQHRERPVRSVPATHNGEDATLFVSFPSRYGVPCQGTRQKNAALTFRSEPCRWFVQGSYVILTIRAWGTHRFAQGCGLFDCSCSRPRPTQRLFSEKGPSYPFFFAQKSLAYDSRRHFRLGGTRPKEEH